MNKLESAFYIGLGLALKGKEKVEEAAKKLADESKMNADEGKKFVNDMVESAEAAKADFDKKIEGIVASVAKNMGFVEQKEVETLKKRITELEELIKQRDND